MAGGCCYCALVCLLITAASPRNAEAAQIPVDSTAVIARCTDHKVDTGRLHDPAPTRFGELLHSEGVGDGDLDWRDLEPTHIPEPPSVIAALVLGSAALLGRRRPRSDS